MSTRLKGPVAIHDPSRTQGRRAAVARWIARQDTVEISDVMAAHGVSRGNAKKILHRLAADGLIWRIRKGVYQAPAPR